MPLLVLVAVASTTLFSGVTASTLAGVAAVDVCGAVEAADVAVLVLEAALVDAAEVDVAAALVDAGAVIAAFAS